jgi:hypothetical protein
MNTLTCCVSCICSHCSVFPVSTDCWGELSHKRTCRNIRCARSSVSHTAAVSFPTTPHHLLPDNFAVCTQLYFLGQSILCFVRFALHMFTSCISSSRVGGAAGDITKVLFFIVSSTDSKNRAIFTTPVALSPVFVSHSISFCFNMASVTWLR